MRKFLTLFLALAVLTSLFTGCGLLLELLEDDEEPESQELQLETFGDIYKHDVVEHGYSVFQNLLIVGFSIGDDLYRAGANITDETEQKLWDLGGDPDKDEEFHEIIDGIRIGDFGCIVNMLYKDGLLVSHASKGEIVSILSKEKLSGRVFKTQDYILENTVNSLPEKRIPLDVKLSIYPSRNVEVNLKCLDDNYTFQSSITAQKALKAPLNKETVIRQFQKLNDTEYFLNDLELNSEDAFLSVSQLNEIRRNAIEQFNKYRLGSFKRDRLESGISLADLKDETDEGEMIQNGDRIFLNDKEYPVNYVINKESRYADSTDGAICEFGGLLKEYRSKIAYYTLNICNSYAYEFLKRLGFDHIVLSSELKDNEISDLIDAYETRNKRIIKPYRLFSGKRVLMYIKSDPFARYAEKGHKYTLDDGNNRYDVNFVNNITEISVNIDKSSANDDCLALIIES